MKFNTCRRTREAHRVSTAHHASTMSPLIAFACLVLSIVCPVLKCEAAYGGPRIADMCADRAVHLFVIWPKDGHVVELELHGLDLVRLEVDILICNFDSIDGSIAVFGTGGETKLQDIWKPKNGRQNITIELPFPQSAGLHEMIGMLEAGRAVEYNVEFSLMDGGFEVGAASSVSLGLVSAHVPRVDRASVRVEHEKPFVYLLSTKHEVVRPDLETSSSDMYQLIWGDVAPTRENAIWAPACTWNEARNKLFEHVRGVGKHYIYLIFTDDDASLSLRPSSVLAGVDTHTKDDPWREFERLLLEWLPAAGYARYTIQQPQETKKEEPDVECVRFADPLFVAYHFEAASFILPYTTDFDTESWWYSAVVANALQSLHFRGHVIQFNTIYVHDNQKSVGYTAFRQMNWERPVRWLIASVGPFDHVDLLGLENPIQVKCDAGVGVHRRTAPYVVASGQFDICHPVFAHLRHPARPSSTRNCTGWTVDGKTTDILLLHAHRLKKRVSFLETNLTNLADLVLTLQAHVQQLQHGSLPAAYPADVNFKSLEI